MPQAQRSTCFLNCCKISAREITLTGMRNYAVASSRFCVILEVSNKSICFLSGILLHRLQVSVQEGFFNSNFLIICLLSCWQGVCVCARVCAAIGGVAVLACPVTSSSVSTAPRRPAEVTPC